MALRLLCKKCFHELKFNGSETPKGLQISVSNQMSMQPILTIRHKEKKSQLDKLKKTYDAELDKVKENIHMKRFK